MLNYVAADSTNAPPFPANSSNPLSHSGRTSDAMDEYPAVPAGGLPEVRHCGGQLLEASRPPKPIRGDRVDLLNTGEAFDAIAAGSPAQHAYRAHVARRTQCRPVTFPRPSAAVVHREKLTTLDSRSLGRQFRAVHVATCPLQARRGWRTGRSPRDQIPLMPQTR